MRAPVSARARIVPVIVAKPTPKMISAMETAISISTNVKPRCNRLLIMVRFLGVVKGKQPPDRLPVRVSWRNSRLIRLGSGRGKPKVSEHKHLERSNQGLGSSPDVD